MNGVLGMADLLMQEPLGDKGRRYAQTIQRSGRALLGVLTDVLDLSKIEAGRMDLVMTRFYLPGLVREIRDLFGESAQAKGVTLSVEVGPEVARWVTGDAVRLRQVMLNLVSNALKFTERGAIEVRARGDETEMVRFEVKDTGIGIATDMQAAIFNPFAQADESATRRYGGTGLGLSIARELVHLMDGQIGVASAPCAGALFWFRVRLPDAPAPARDGGMAGKALGGRRVLVAEDDAVNAEVTQAMLVRHGIEVVMADDGAQAVAAHARGRFDLILMDCRMPALDGFEATRRIRDAEAARGTPGTPIVALTAHAMTGYRQQCLDAGMDDYLVKPYEGAAFDTMLGRWLD